VDEDIRPVVLNVLNTGATFSRVQRIKNSESYYVHKDLYKALARIRAREVGRRGVQQRQFAQIAPREGAKAGGSLTPPPRAIADQTRVKKANDIEDSEPDFLNGLIEALGVDPVSFTSLQGSAFEAASAAAEVLFALRQGNRLLDQELTARDQQDHARLERVFAHLDSQIAVDDGRKRQRLVAAWEEMEQSWPVIMLLPNGPYEAVSAELVEQLEPDSGAGMLKGDDQLLLVIARSIHQALASNPRITDRDWIGLEQQFQLVLRTPTQQVADGDAKRTLN
jgi:hypothetical protein